MCSVAFSSGAVLVSLSGNCFPYKSVIRFLGCNIVAGMNWPSHLLPACWCPSHIVLSADTRRVERPHPCNMSSGWKQSVVKEVSGRDAMCPVR